MSEEKRKNQFNGITKRKKPRKNKKTKRSRR